MTEITLAPIKESTEEYEAIEKHIVALFRKEIYEPILREFNLGTAVLRNAASSANDDLISAIQSGRITFSRGAFYGSFNANISKALKGHGATWDRGASRWKILLSDLPGEIRLAISSSEFRYQEKLKAIDKILAQNLPEKIAEQLSIEKMFDRTLWKVDRDFKASVKGITVAPTLTKEQRARIAAEWQEDLERYVKDFTEKETVELRKSIKSTVFSGARYQSAVSTIEKSYRVSQNKARFLARQETGLLMAKFKEVRYADAGIKEYKWGCVSGTKNHPVRPWHKSLEGKTFSWDNPPITSKPGEPKRANNPGQDYNCRCFARPVVRFKK